MKKNMKIVLIDCNDAFRALMLSFADSRGLDLVCYRSVLAMGSVASFSSFDVAIVENDHGTLSGIEVGEYLTALLQDMPMVLISCGIRPSRSVENTWPKAIRSFVHKNDGPDAIFDSALQFRVLAS